MELKKWLEGLWIIDYHKRFAGSNYTDTEKTSSKTGGRLQLITIWTSRSHDWLYQLPPYDQEMQHHKCSLFPWLVRLHLQSQTMQWLLNIYNQNQNARLKLNYLNQGILLEYLEINVTRWSHETSNNAHYFFMKFLVSSEESLMCLDNANFRVVFM